MDEEEAGTEYDMHISNEYISDTCIHISDMIYRDYERSYIHAIYKTELYTLYKQTETHRQTQRDRR